MSVPRLSAQTFAADVAERLALIAQGVGQSVDHTFCPALSAELWLISQQLRDKAENLPLNSRLSKLLSNLEKLCKPTPGFSKLAVKSLPKIGGLDVTSRYPGLAQLWQDNRKYALEGIRRLAIGRSPEVLKRQKDILRILQSFSGPLVATTVNSVSEIKTTSEVWVGDDFTGSVRLLYKVLSSYTSCKVGSETSEIAAKLRLAISARPGGDSPAFELMFLAHPHNEHQRESLRWRETRICVDRRKTKFKHIAGEDVQVVMDGPIQITDLCERISTRDQYQLSLMVSNEQLQFIEWCEGARSWVPNSPSVSLNTILRNHTLSKKMKYILSFLLSKSVWQFYHTEWMGKEWTKDSIHFMFERRGTANSAGVYLNEPFISSHFDPKANQDDARFRPHKFPKIKALGIILLEIELGIVIEDHFGPDCFAIDGEVNVDADLFAALELYDNPDKLEDTFPLLKTVIGDCLRPSKFVAHRNSIEEVRTALQQHVVDHLHTLVGLYGQPEKLELRPTVMMDPSKLPPVVRNSSRRPPLSPKDENVQMQQSQPGCDHSQNCSSPPPNTLLKRAPIALEHGALRPRKVLGSVATCIRHVSSEDWFDELDKLNDVLCSMPGEIDQTYHRVRVAVIDTGINGSDSYAKHISGYKDFVGGNDEIKQDNTGHGTNSVKLIYKMYDQAEVYVARVFEYSEANEDTQDLMLQAIQHAREVWKADIISIASGFEKDHPATRRAIKRAATDGILIFAAASNYGNIRHVTFPARMQDVICVFCTDGRAKVSSSINPAPQTTKSKNFAILGEGVMVPPSTTDLVTGTSVATCIAAGLAGRLLDFSRQKDCQNRIRCAENLASVEGISAVFAHMAKGAEDHNYNCVVPGRLLQHLDEDEERYVKRQRVCERLSTALENIDLDG
ncbi:Fc.00g106610.m01.CDS01 [Cosmosporella sp. VM-42]